MSEPKKLIGLTDKQIKLLKTILSLDLDAIGFEADDRLTALAIRKLLAQAMKP